MWIKKHSIYHYNSGDAEHDIPILSPFVIDDNIGERNYS